MSRKSKRGDNIKRTGIAIDISVLDDVQLIADMEQRKRNKMIEMLLRAAASQYWINHKRPDEQTPPR